MDRRSSSGGATGGTDFWRRQWVNAEEGIVRNIHVDTLGIYIYLSLAAVSSKKSFVVEMSPTLRLFSRGDVFLDDGLPPRTEEDIIPPFHGRR